MLTDAYVDVVYSRHLIVSCKWQSIHRKLRVVAPEQRSAQTRATQATEMAAAFVGGAASIRRRSVTDYMFWEEATRDGGIIDEEEERRDILERSGAYAGVDNGPAHDSFTYGQDEAGKCWSLSYASPTAKRRHEALVEKAKEADLAPGGREAQNAVKRLKKNAEALGQ